MDEMPEMLHKNQGAEILHDDSLWGKTVEISQDGFAPDGLQVLHGVRAYHQEKVGNRIILAAIGGVMGDEIQA
ncbi:MAG: hypothetical protein H6577_25765 [Lewinellaceae bacterium]|nr:hypothetical protein [Lewinellaceae bacterium]